MASGWPDPGGRGRDVTTWIAEAFHAKSVIECSQTQTPINC